MQGSGDAAGRQALAGAGKCGQAVEQPLVLRFAQAVRLSDGQDRRILQEGRQQLRQALQSPVRGAVL